VGRIEYDPFVLLLKHHLVLRFIKIISTIQQVHCGRCCIIILDYIIIATVLVSGIISILSSHKATAAAAAAAAAD